MHPLPSPSSFARSTSGSAGAGAPRATSNSSVYATAGSCSPFSKSLCRMLLLLSVLGLIAMIRESQSLRDLSAVMLWTNQQANEENDDSSQKAFRIAWLLSYPNSGTSYTMTLVERASNLSTATNYGAEVTPRALRASEALPTYSASQGPYWEGLEGAAVLNRTIRQLPDPYNAFVLTKTHCGGRCINCGPSDYVIQEPRDFLEACLKTSYLDADGHRHESHMPQERVAKLVHLIRNPLHNIVARYHLERRHFVLKNKSLAKQFPNDASGFQKWCSKLDDTYMKEERKHFLKSDPQLLKLFENVPCHAEFFKYTQWHNSVIHMHPLLHRPPQLTIFYEDYQYAFRNNVDSIMQFVSQPYNASRLRAFRSLPTYEDYFSEAQIESIHQLIKHVALPQVYGMLQRYFNNIGEHESDADDVDALASQ
ncbi:hypothetical protein MPSEU_000755100 [Mayamaea pseudoterrestris]|nr:hypothetical protein MPSEU_000755100 [Mayamaea pseudoterrestris]